jgi:ADP-heptose:LPS heptosyltransferase
LCFRSASYFWPISDNMRIVVYRAGALGDTLLTFPALAALHKQWPAARITLICRADVHALALASGLVDRTWSHALPEWMCLFDNGVAPSDLARETFGGVDLALIWAADAGGEVASQLRALGVQQTLVAEPPPQAGSRRHAALQLLDSLAPLGLLTPTDLIELSASLPKIRWPQEAQDEADGEWERLQGELAGRPAVAIHPGSGGARKRWPPGQFAALIRSLRRDYAPVLIAGPQDVEVVAQVTVEAGATPTVRDLSVAGLAACLSQCQFFVGNDAGVTHLASLLGVSTIALFGPTDPAIWAPLGPRVVMLQSATGRMEDLLPEEVLAAIARWDLTPQTSSPMGEGEPDGD